jgi:hypothetical protein
MPTPLLQAAPMTHVADVERTVLFYQMLGMQLASTHRAPDGRLVWADLRAGTSRMMFTLASGPIDSSQQAILFYLYSESLVALREELIAAGIEVGPIRYPFYMEKGEIRLEDPDRYVLLIGQAG